MKVDKKTILFLAIFGEIILVFLIYLLFNQIKEESERLIFQKNRLAELEIKAENLKKFQETRESYWPNLEKISKLFINPAEPINFIEFLEKETQLNRLSIEITPLSREEGKDLWPFMNFSLSVKGFFPDFLKFLERMESNTSFLIEIQNLSVRRVTEKELGKKEEIQASLLIKVYSQ